MFQKIREIVFKISLILWCLMQFKPCHQYDLNIESQLYIVWNILIKFTLLFKLAN